ncbi:ST-I family heat-stable enterotoxin [Cytobacillus horneckiae]
MLAQGKGRENNRDYCSSIKCNPAC